MSDGGSRDRFLKPAILTFAIFLGCGFLWLGLSSILLVNESSGWPTTDGYVTESYVTHAGRGGELYFRYEYVVESQQYHSHTISYSFDGSLVYFAEKYPQGSYVQVHYDPNDPSRAVLEHDFDLSHFDRRRISRWLFSRNCDHVAQMVQEQACFQPSTR
jgi:hypothetical protein